MSLARAFVQHLAADAWSQDDLVALESRLQDVVNACQRAWPALDVAPEPFLAYLAQRLPETPSVSEALGKVHVEELYLAFACAQGGARAIAALEARYGSHIEAVLGGFHSPGLAHDDLRQIVRERLFIADRSNAPKIARYSGQGSLAAWLRITVRRAALNAQRNVDPAASPRSSEDPFDFPPTLGDPELDYLKQTYSAQFREAFAEAVGALSTRERTVLRQSVIHQLTVRQIGRMYRVHHGTAARWIAQARERLIEGTRASLLHRLEVSERQLDSIMALIQSRLDVSVARVLDD